jgi:hypothetical protein
MNQKEYIRKIISLVHKERSRIIKRQSLITKIFNNIKKRGGLWTI